MLLRLRSGGRRYGKRQNNRSLSGFLSYFVIPSSEKREHDQPHQAKANFTTISTYMLRPLQKQNDGDDILGQQEDDPIEL